MSSVFVDVLFILTGRRNKDIVGLRIKGLVSKETVVLRRRGGDHEAPRFGIKQV